MLYVGNFSFDMKPEEDKTSEPFGDHEEGSFTCLIEAETVDEAFDKFHDYFLLLDKTSDAFQDVGNIYVDSIAEIKKMPDHGVLAFIEERSSGPGFSSSINTTDIGASEDYITLYSWDDHDPESEEGQEATPFLTYDRE